MTDLVTCSTCGAPGQEVGKFCEQCGAKVELISATPASDPAMVADTSAPDDAAAPATPADSTPAMDDAAPAMDNAAPAMDDAAPAMDNAAPAMDNAAPAMDNAAPAMAVADAAAAPTVPSASAAPDGGASSATGTMRFIRLENGVFNRDHSFDLPVGGRLLVGRTDPANGIFPEVDVTMWSKRVATPEGSLYTVHRKQCYISRDDGGRVWIVDHEDYLGDTMVSPVGTAQFRPIPTLAGSGERAANNEGGVELQVGDRILMGQGDGMLIFQLMSV